MQASKVALVTGASRGIGADIARNLAANGFAVVVNYAGNAAKAAEVVAEIEAAGGTALAVQADIADEAAVDALFQTTLDRFGRLDAVVNNAGIIGYGTLEDGDIAAFDRIVATNLRGAFLVLGRAAASGQHDVLALGQLGDGLALALTKGRFALDLENRGDAHASARLDFVVGVVEGFAGFTRQSAPDGGFTRPHQPDQKEIASNMYHARHSTQRPAARATLQRSIGPCVWLGGARVGQGVSLRPCLLCVNGV